MDNAGDASKDSEEEEELENSSESPSKQDQNPDIKSTAVVTYTKMGLMETYSTLERNTDIKQPPDNWLRDNLQGRFSSWTSAKDEPLELSSLNMAHTFPENIDEVDVISDAENIKKLLKMPFSKTGISMSVNKVGRTLLLDKFDVEKLLSQAAQKENLETLTWLQDVFSVEANMEKDQTVLPKKKNPSESLERSMMSKFLCYSSPEDSIGKTLGDECPSRFPDHSKNIVGETSKRPIRAQALMNPCKALVPFLPEPILKPHEKSPFQRNVLWKFEDTNMLIGSNMPIFGGGKYPAVSLRLKDCSKPINVLTGLDYWLDNLMCNVPEVVMCFHLDGIVQKYEHYKTDELPHIEGSQFSPGVIKDVARNILSFLKSNCTLEGHTYWLFKGSGSDVVKLYDLTSLYDKAADDESTNPFSVPVAMLLYRVAKNMISELKITPRERDMVHVLLTNCLRLLSNEPNPDDHLEIITSVHYLLAEVYSLGKENGVDDLLDNANKSGEARGGGEKDEGFPWPKTLTIGDLSKSNDFEEAYEEVSVDFPSDVNEKLHLSLSHVVKAFKNLRGAWGDRKFSNPSNESKRNNLVPSRLYLLALPDAGFRDSSETEIFPLPVEHEEAIGEASPLNFNFRQWQGTFESVLMRKAAGLYVDLASLAHAHGAHGLALRYSRLSLGCLSSYRNMEWVNANKELDLLPTILCACGDVYLALTRSHDVKESLEQCEREYGELGESDQYFEDTFGYVDDATYSLNVEFIPDVEKLFMTSLKFYERALDSFTDEQQEEQLIKLTKRLGNIRNELGLFYMNTAMKKSAGLAQEVMDEVQGLWKKSLDSFSGGIRAFEALDDSVNVALLYSNSGRLMRICSQTIFNTPVRLATFDTQEKAYYSKAIEYYQNSLRTLRERKSYPEIWDRVSWELSGTYYAVGTLVQDFASSVDAEPEQCEREVSDWMFKALKYCESLEYSSEQKNKNVKNRIGMIHYRLGSLYHNSYRMTSISDQNTKNKKHLADLHYGKALVHLDAAMFPCQWLRTNLERVALLEHQLSSARGKGPGAIKTLDAILELLLDSQKVFEAASSRKDDEIDEGKSAEVGAKNTEPIFSKKKAHDGEKGAKKLAEVDATSPGGFSSKSSEGDTASAESQKYNSMYIASLNEPGGMTDMATEEERSKEFSNLIGIFESRLKNSLKEFLRVASSLAKGSSASQSPKHTREEVLKRMFELTLRAGVSSTADDDLRTRCETLLGTIVALKKLQNSVG